MAALGQARVGMPVVKFGAATHETRGYITSLNRSWHTVWPRNTALYHHGLLEMTYDSAGGDSGSPIFIEGTNGWLYLIGIHWGFNQGQYPRRTFGSCIHAIMQQLNITIYCTDVHNLTAPYCW